MAEKKEKQKLLMYKDKPLVRKGELIFYGFPTDKYIVQFTLSNFEEVNGIKVARHVLIQLQQNTEYMNLKNKVVKKAERDGLWAALDIGAFWLADALKHG